MQSRSITNCTLEENYFLHFIRKEIKKKKAELKFALDLAAAGLNPDPLTP